VSTGSKLCPWFDKIDSHFSFETDNKFVVRLQAPDGPAPAGLRGDPTPARRSSS